MLFKIIVIGLLLSAVIGVIAETPSEFMEEFIQECDKMMDTFKTCENEWLVFEDEIISSVDSFSERIVYTESLIMTEADMIIDMADRIVASEDILIGVSEQCGCTLVTSRKNGTVSEKNYASSAGSIVVVDDNKIEQEKLPVGAGDSCSAADEMFSVMDECMVAFEAFNSDFLEVLSSLVCYH